jgi:hypothetical protein
VVVGNAGIVLLVVAPATLVDVVVGKTSDVVDACVLVVVVEPPTPPVVVVAGVVGVVVVEPPPGSVVGVVVVETPGSVNVVVVEPTGRVVELGSVVPETVVVVVTPAQVHALQRSPHGPRLPSHASPASGSQTPSPQALSDARNGVVTPADFATIVPASVRQLSVIVPVSVTLPASPKHELHRARIFIPRVALPRTRDLTGAQPLATPTIFPAMSTTSIGSPSSSPTSGGPLTR